MQQTDNSTERESHLKDTEPMRIHHYPLKTGITRTPEFEKKGLATHAVNVGTKCGHNCLYCSTGAVPLYNGTVVQLLEPNASSIQDRMLAMVEAAARGLRTYAMFCPLLPGIADSEDAIERMLKFAVDCRAEEIFAEPVNPRGPGLRLCQEALAQNGYRAEAEAIGRIRQKANWSKYVADLIAKTQSAIRNHFDISKLRFLLYPSGLSAEDRARIEQDDAGVVWLG